MANPTAAVQVTSVDFDDMDSYWPIPIVADTYYPGEMIGKRDSDGLAQHFDDTQALTFLGFSVTTPRFVVTTDLPTQACLIKYRRPRLFSMPLVGSTVGSRLTDIGKKAFAKDSGHVQLTSTTFENIAGIVVDVLTKNPEDTTTPAGGSVILYPWVPGLDKIGDAGGSGVLTAPATGGKTYGAEVLNRVVLVPNTAGETITLPPVANSSPGDHITFIKTTANNAITFAANASENINGANTYVSGTAQYTLIRLISDQTQWFIDVVSTFPGNVTVTGLLAESAADALTAVGTTQGGGLALTKQINRVTTAANATAPFNGVVLPASVAGYEIEVINASANPIQVYGAGTDTINGVATATGVTQPASSVVEYSCTVAGLWFAEGIGIGYSGSFPTDSFTDNLTAVGTNQATALLLAAEVNRVTVGAGTTGVLLPPAAGGLGIIVINHAPQSIHVYGSGTDTIDDVATATGVVQMVNSIAIYFCTTAGPGGKWYSEGIGTGFTGGLQTVNFADALTAVGTTQGTALALTNALNRISSSAAAVAPFNGVSLPASTPGLTVTLINSSSNPIQVYGAGTDTINSIATATGISQGVNVVATYNCTVAGNWVVQFSYPQQSALFPLPANQAIASHTAHSYVITKGSIEALTLAAPTSGTDDGIVIQITSNTAFAHTLTATGLLQTASASVNVATFAAFAGATLTLQAYAGKWNVLSQNGITFS